MTILSKACKPDNAQNQMPKQETRNYYWITWEVNTVWYWNLASLSNITRYFFIKKLYKKCGLETSSRPNRNANRSYASFFENAKKPGTSSQATVFVKILDEIFSFVIWKKLAKFHQQTVFTS